MKTRMIMMFVIVAMFGCSNGVDGHRIMEPDGNAGVLVKCRLGSPWRCMEEVQNQCPSGYTIVSQPDPEANHSPYSPGLVQQGQAWVIHVSCGKAKESISVQEKKETVPNCDADGICHSNLDNSKYGF